MRYEKPFKKLTFYKAFFSPQWKFFIHTILQCLSAKTTLWNEFSSAMASAIICLANNQKFNFLKYILDNLKKNLEDGVPFYMFPRIGFSEAVTPLFGTMMVQAVKEVGDLPTDVQDTSIPDTPSSFQPHRKHKPRRKEKKEAEVIEIKSSHKVKIVELDSMVEKLEEENMSLTKELKSFNTKVKSSAIKETMVDKEESSKQGRKIADINTDAEVNLKNVYNLDMAHEETVLSMQDVTDADVKKVSEEMVEVITTDKIIVNKVSTTGGELNAANEEPVNSASTNITTAQPSKATKTIVDITTAPKAKEIVFHDKKESTTRTVSSKSQVKDKGKAKLVDEEVARRIEAQWNADMKDNIDWNEVIKQVQSRQSDVPPTIMDYKIYMEGKKEHFQITRANGNHQMYLASSTMLKNFDREDLKVLWKIVKDRFKESQPKEVRCLFMAYFKGLSPYVYENTFEVFSQRGLVPVMTLMLSVVAIRYITKTSSLIGALLSALKKRIDFLAPFDKNQLSAVSFSLRLCFPSTVMVLRIPVMSTWVHAKTSGLDLKRSCSFSLKFDGSFLPMMTVCLGYLLLTITLSSASVQLKISSISPGILH
uniref:Synaptobrevin, longin-like domain protein n=1 Tax=Tanacetum cinerariifolium TaxID=118510 RepID=A0A6L2LXA9_TANCI|nr:hypothetical protein [Tanacetum cinerariifolium]